MRTEGVVEREREMLASWPLWPPRLGHSPRLAEKAIGCVCVCLPGGSSSRVMATARPKFGPPDSLARKRRGSWLGFGRDTRSVSLAPALGPRSRCSRGPDAIRGAEPRRDLPKIGSAAASAKAPPRRRNGAISPRTQDVGAAPDARRSRRAASQAPPTPPAAPPEAPPRAAPAAAAPHTGASNAARRAERRAVHGAAASDDDTEF